MNWQEMCDRKTAHWFKYKNEWVGVSNEEVKRDDEVLLIRRNGETSVHRVFAVLTQIRERGNGTKAIISTGMRASPSSNSGRNGPTSKSMTTGADICVPKEGGYLK